MRTCMLVAIVMLTAPVSAQSPASPSCQAIVPPSDSTSGRFGAVAPGPGNRLAWHDGRSSQVMLRDNAGKVRVVGRSGAGPGEFDRPGYMSWKGDTLWVSDYRLVRVQFFSDTGRLLRVSTAMLPGNWGAGLEGRLVGFGPVMAAMDQPWILLSHMPGTVKLDSLGSFPAVAVDRFELPLRDQSVTVPQPLAPRTIAANSADFSRFCAAIPEGSTLRIRCMNNAGGTLIDRPVTLRPRTLPDAVYDSLIAGYMRAPGRIESVLRSRIHKPRMQRLAEDMLVERSGVMWIRRTDRVESSAIWTRLSGDGAVIGDLTLPRRLRILLADGEIFWAAQPDADDLETLVRCRIPS